MRARMMYLFLSVCLTVAWPSDSMVRAAGPTQPMGTVQPNETVRDGLWDFIQRHTKAIAVKGVRGDQPSEVVNYLFGTGRLGVVRSNAFMLATTKQIDRSELAGKTLYITRGFAMAENESLVLALVNSLKRLATPLEDVVGPSCMVIVAPGVGIEKGIVAEPEGETWRDGARIVLSERGNALLRYIVARDALEQTLGACGRLVTLLSTADPILSHTTRVVLDNDLLSATKSLVINQSTVTQASRLVTRDGAVRLEGDTPLTEAARLHQ